jgi:carbonic anhydrase/acetyltransferase-like protein (isoleucine patch superfamily)
LGTPAKVVREITSEEAAWIDRETKVLEAKAARYLSQK